MSIDVKKRDEIDALLKPIVLQYLDLYRASDLRIEVNIRRKPESIKLKIADFRNL